MGYRIQETLSEDILQLVKAPPRSDYPIFLPDDLVNFDAFLFGVPTRYGNFPVQWKVRPPLTHVGACVSHRDSLGILGRNWPTLGSVRPCWKDVWCLRLDRHPGWWTRGHHRQLPLHLCPPRTDLRPSRVQTHLFSNVQPDRGPWWYVYVSFASSYPVLNFVSWNSFFPSPQVLLGVRERLQAWMAPANRLPSNWKSHLSKVRASGRSSPSTTLSPSKLSSLAFFSSPSAHVYLARWSSARVAVVCRGSGVHDARNLGS